MELKKVSAILDNQNITFREIKNLLESQKNENGLRELVSFVEAILQKDSDIKKGLDTIVKIFNSRFLRYETNINESTHQVKEKDKIFRILKIENEQLKERIKNLESLNIETISENKFLKDNLEKATNESEENRAKYNCASTFLSAATKKIYQESDKDIVERLNKEINKDESKITSLQKIIRELEKKYTQLETDYENLLKLSEEKARKLSEFEVKINSLRNENNMLEKGNLEREQKQQMIQVKEDQYNELFQNYCKLLKENEKLYSDNIQATKGIKHLR